MTHQITLFVFLDEPRYLIFFSGFFEMHNIVAVESYHLAGGLLLVGSGQRSSSESSNAVIAASKLVL